VDHQVSGSRMVYLTQALLEYRSSQVLVSTRDQVTIAGQLQRIDGEGGGLLWLEPKTDASVAVRGASA
jgi:hypothetical protein